MWYEETDIIFGLRASISIKITYFLCYRKIMLASVIHTYWLVKIYLRILEYITDTSKWVVLVKICMSVKVVIGFPGVHIQVFFIWFPLYNHPAPPPFPLYEQGKHHVLAYVL